MLRLSNKHLGLRDSRPRQVQAMRHLVQAALERNRPESRDV
jgi:hypothetical protein